MKPIPIATLVTLTTLLATTAQAAPVDDLIAGYVKAGASPSLEAGRAFWSKEHPDPKSGGKRSCATCHGPDLTRTGKHIKTGKAIEPLAPSANPKRLQDPAEVEKWFRRNCSWTLGRHCTAQEKADILTYLRTL